MLESLVKNATVSYILIVIIFLVFIGVCVLTILSTI